MRCPRPSGNQGEGNTVIEPPNRRAGDSLSAGTGSGQPLEWAVT